MKIILNGEEVAFDRQINISNLLEKYALDKRKIAVEKNLEIVPHSSFEEVELYDCRFRMKKLFPILVFIFHQK